jgi:hypothetical protein
MNILIKLKVMKRIVSYILTAAAGCLMLVACGTDDADIERDETLLYGKWLLTSENGGVPMNPGKEGVEKLEYWRYNSDGTGTTWDESDDISEEEGFSFTWSLNLSELMQIYVTEMVPRPDGTRAAVPKVYTITELDETTLSYEDSFDSYTFTKQ